MELLRRGYFHKRHFHKNTSFLSSLDSLFHLSPTHQLLLVLGSSQLPTEILGMVLWILDSPKSTCAFIFVLHISIFKWPIHLSLVPEVTNTA